MALLELDLSLGHFKGLSLYVWWVILIVTAVSNRANLRSVLEVNRYKLKEEGQANDSVYRVGREWLKL